mgnify:CR=1 FL=1
MNELTRMGISVEGLFPGLIRTDHGEPGSFTGHQPGVTGLPDQETGGPRSAGWVDDGEVVIA